jgi:hypothetical protein
VHLLPGTTEVPDHSAANAKAVSFKILAEVEFTGASQGVVVAQGSRFGGYDVERHLAAAIARDQHQLSTRPTSGAGRGRACSGVRPARVGTSRRRPA